MIGKVVGGAQSVPSAVADGCEANSSMVLRRHREMASLAPALIAMQSIWLRTHPLPRTVLTALTRN